MEQGWRQSGKQGALQSPVGEFLLPVEEKLTIRRGIFTDEHICVLYKLWTVAIDLAKKENRLLSSCQT